MLLVTFHGGKSKSAEAASKPPINNVHAYNTPDGSKLTHAALADPGTGELSELRSMVLANNLLYVANGAKSQSTVLAYQLPAAVPASGPVFTNPSVLIGPTLEDKQFTTSIAHPFGIAFDDPKDPTTCYISNQDTNVVCALSMSSGGLGNGSQSGYLNGLFPAGSFLDGTFVASQVGALPDVSLTATVVDHVHGGLGASFSGGKVKNSVRDVAIANGMLFVCDEPEKVVDFYALADGNYLGSSNRLGASPTHLAIDNGGLYVSAGALLYWVSLPPSPPSSLLDLLPVALTPPEAGNKIGGISFDDASSTVYIPFQEATGDSTKAGGSIYRFTVTPGSPPKLSNPTEFVASAKLHDTPEFVLYWSGP